MYFQFVENIFVYDSNVVAGEMTHKRVDKPTEMFFSEEIESNSLEKIRSLALESADIGICRVNNREDQFIIINLGPDENILEQATVLGKKIIKFPKITFI